MTDIGKPQRRIVADPVAPPQMPNHDLPMEDPGPTPTPVAPTEPAKEPVSI